ncbi:MAG: GAF domain-containing protein [Oscillatoria sp. PMC 1068.18]|nr:GAF domain-containing protein [Oscillatoria sp. PMC 1076.18]MEC4991644.1 GAF domain-containing protein [Oscillatoria sp. PMC 1068.18]
MKLKNIFQAVTNWIKYSQTNKKISYFLEWNKVWYGKNAQEKLYQKIVNKIRNSLNLKVVLQTAVDEVAELFQLECCAFLWYYQDAEKIKVECESRLTATDKSLLGDRTLSDFGSRARDIIASKMMINFAHPAAVGEILQLFQVKPKAEQQAIWGYQGYLLVPVRGMKERTGFLCCLDKKPRLWSKKEIAFLKSIAQALEIAIAQAHLYEQTEKQATRERLVNEIVSHIRSSLELETILTRAIAKLLSALEIDRCLIHLVENDGEKLKNSQKINQDTAYRRKYLYEVCREGWQPCLENFDPNGPISQWVIKNQQQVAIADISQDPRVGENNPEYQQAEIKSSLVVPVQTKGKLQAILYLNQCSHHRTWSKNDIQLAQVVADRLAIAIQQAHLYAEKEAQAQQLASTLKKLQLTQSQLIQNEKMLSLGQMVAGVAHEINNPINLISANIPYLEHYTASLIQLVQAYQQETTLESETLAQLSQDIELDFLLADIPKILASMKSGAARIQEIVQLLQNFSRQNQAKLKSVDIHAALESTIAILSNRIQNNIHIERHYSDLPLVECYPKAINQVFFSLLTNSLEALARDPNPGKKILLQTELVNNYGQADWIKIAIADNGPGIPKALHSRIFDPFFTTKDVGQGRGLGLTASYHTIVNQHQGKLELQSQPNQGAQFIIEIPLKQQYQSSRDRVMLV